MLRYTFRWKATEDRIFSKHRRKATVLAKLDRQSTRCRLTLLIRHGQKPKSIVAHTFDDSASLNQTKLVMVLTDQRMGDEWSLLLLLLGSKLPSSHSLSSTLCKFSRRWALSTSSNWLLGNHTLAPKLSTMQSSERVKKEASRGLHVNRETESSYKLQSRDALKIIREKKRSLSLVSR